MFGVIVGTGTGGGIVVDGRVLTGPNAIAGEWGHNPLPWPRDDERPGPACYCGKTGCIETFLSGPGLAHDYRAASGVELEAPEIVTRAERGDRGRRAALGRYEDRMARALAVVLNLLDPDVVVLGGGMSRVARLYESVPRLLAGVGVLGSDHDAAAAAAARRLERRARRGVALGQGRPVAGRQSGLQSRMPYRALDSDQIERTIEQLARRVESRFDGSGLAQRRARAPGDRAAHLGDGRPGSIGRSSGCAC